MPRSQGTAVSNNFAKALISEASALTFPKDTCIETENCIHNLDGSVERRPGFNLESNYSTKTVDRSDSVINSYYWNDVAGDGDFSMAVVQVGERLYFYAVNTQDNYTGSPTDPLSSHAITSNILLTDFSSPSAPSPATADCQFASGNGKLFVANPYTDPFSVSYNPDTNTFTGTRITIKIRDFEGLPDGLNIDQRPSVGLGAVTDTHLYNLYNQGWTEGNLAVWDAARTDLPSNADVMWRFKNASDAFDVSTVPNVMNGNSPASKGHFVLDAFNKQRGSISGIISIAPETSGYQRPTAIAFFAGRLFYAGINYEGYNSKIYFSQIIERDEQFGHCYQTNDPTSETLFDLLPIDGGTLDIQEAGTIFKLITIPGGLLVFASNGVWFLTGSSGIGFTANDYTAVKLSTVSTFSSSSFVDLQGLPAWWNLEGIYQVQAAGGGGGSYTVTSLTDATIKSVYNTIPPSEKKNARGFYNPYTKIVQWLYRTEEAGTIEDYYDYNRILNLDLRTGGFYIWTIPEHDIKIHGMVVLQNRGGQVGLEDVTDNLGDVVEDNDGNPVQTWTVGNAIVLPKFKYVITYDDNGNTYLTFADCANETWKDWTDFDEVDYTSYFRTGYALQNGLTDFQTNYITLYVEKDSTLEFKGIWDFANTGNSGRWSTPQRVDASNSDYFNFKPFRRKVRGHGRAAQIQVDSVSGKKFKLSGWATYITGNQTV